MAQFVYKIGGTGTAIDEAGQQQNARAIQSILQGMYGWTLVAVCGALGCFQAESDLNPGIYETSHGGDLSNLPFFPGGMGLAQWTDYPAYSGQYPNPLPWAADRDKRLWYDGNYQCFLCTRAEDPIYTDMGIGQGARWGWQTSSSYPSISFTEYQKYSGAVADAVKYWFYDFEWHYNVVPDGYLEYRIAAGEKWYEFLSGQPPLPPTPSERKKSKLIFYLKNPNRR